MPTLLKGFDWSPDGCHVIKLSAGQYADGDLPERALEIAAQLGLLASDEQPNPAGKQPEQPAEKKGKK